MRDARTGVWARKEAAVVSRWDWAVRLLTRRLWFEAALYGGAAIATALGVAPLVPDKAAALIGADAVEDIVKIPSSSLLAAATFLLGTIFWPPSLRPPAR